MSSEVEVFTQHRALSRYPTVSANRFTVTYKQLYMQLLNQGLQEFPPIEGYETMHLLILERAIYAFCKMKEIESNPVDMSGTKAYESDFKKFRQSCEALLREAKNISLETTFKHNFVLKVLEVIDRVVADPSTKLALSRELRNLAVT